jgi:hypothetical protein
MSDVDAGDDDISPWARDDWTSSADQPQLDDLSSPERQHADSSSEPERSTAGQSNGGPSRPQVLLAGAVGIGFLVVGVAAMLRGGDTAVGPVSGSTVQVSTSDVTVPQTTVPQTVVTATITAAPESASTATPIAPAVVGEVPTWTESSIVVPAPLDGLTAPTELVTLSPDRILQRIELPTGRVRSLDLDGWGDQPRLAVGDDSIAVYDGRDVAVIRDDDVIRRFVVPDGVLFLEAWPATSSFIVTSSGSPSGRAERFVLRTDDGSLTPLTEVASDAMVFGAASFLSTGEMLVNGPGGVYSIGPDQQARRISGGDLLAVGRNHYAVEDCDESLQCTQFVVEAVSGIRSAAVLDDVTGFGIVDPSMRIAPDGRSIVGTDSSRDTGYRQIIDVATGDRLDVGRLAAIYYPDTWAADSSGLFLEDGGVVRFQVRDRAEVVTIDTAGEVDSLMVRPG